MADTDWLDDNVELFAISALSADEARRFQSEYDRCTAVERSIYDGRLAEIHTTMASFATMYAMPAPPELREPLLTRVFTTAPAEAVLDRDSPVEEPAPSTGKVVDLNSRRRTLGLAVAAAATVVAVALGAGVLIGRHIAPTSAPTVSAADQNTLDVLRAPDASLSVTRLADNRGALSVVASRSQNRAVAVLREQTTPLPADRTFQLWLVGGTRETPVSAGLLAGTGVASPVLIDRIDTSQVLAITIEPAGGSVQPTTEILAQVPL